MKIISSILFSGIFFCTACSNKSSLIESPQKSDIYIFEENAVYFPIMVDSVSGEQIFCVNSSFKFVEAVPELEDLPKSDFDFTFHLIYEKAELKRLYDSGSIIEIYRP